MEKGLEHESLGYGRGEERGNRNRPETRRSPSLDKVNKSVHPTRTSRGTCEAITGGPGRIFSIVFPLLLPLQFLRRFFVRGASPPPSSTPNREIGAWISRIANREHEKLREASILCFSSER